MKWFRRGVIGLALLALLAASGGWLVLRSSLPQTEGEFALPGLRTLVQVTRDAYGIPRIKAQNDADAYFALGVVHAQDRLW
jgi:penicillin amidase